MDTSNYTELFKESNALVRLQGKTRVELLKAIEDYNQACDQLVMDIGLTSQLFLEHPGYSDLRTVLGSRDQEKLQCAVLKQDWTGIPEYGEEFYRVLEVAVKRQNLQRAFVRLALDLTDHGFEALDKNLVYHASLVGDLYEKWYRVFCQTVQGTATAKQLEEDDKAGTLPKELYNHYTVISRDPETGVYSQVANAVYYRNEFSDIVAAFDRWIAELEKVETKQTDVKQKYLVYLSSYRTALAETEVEKLESRWTEVDQVWMDVRHWIQVVHDIEYGYGDPLRCKVSPEFSIRLMDETYREQNVIIQEIQDKMVAYFKQRPAKLAQDGISGLQKSMAGIYYVPFQQGILLFFRPAGQSIPNRADVKLSCGVKIYFDPVSTKARDSKCIEIAETVCADPKDSSLIDTVETIVYHIAAHEVGHAIYSLDASKEHIQNSTRTLLEEPRAELTAMLTLRLLQKQGYISEALTQKVLAAWMLQDLRRFVMYDFSSVRPYLISAMSNWARADRLKYATLDANGKVSFDHSKATAFLEDCSKQFETILDAQDQGDGPAIENVLNDMTSCEQNGVVKYLVDELFHKPRAQAVGA